LKTITRRDVLGRGLGGGAILAAGAAARPALADPLGQPIGLQLWTVKDQLDADLDATLARVAAIGYRRVEAAGYHGLSPAAFAERLARAGLACDSAHTSIPLLAKDLDAQAAAAHALGARWLLCASPDPSGAVAPAHLGEDWMDQMRRAMTLDDWRRNAELMNGFGARLQTAGIGFAYHSHAFEFARYDGVVGFDELQRRLDPALVRTELDLGWVVAGGEDPVAVMRRYADRVRLLHVKDLKARPVPGRPTDYATVPVGSGVIDWPPIFAEARRIGVSAYFVEQEPPFTTPVFGDLAGSYKYLHGLR
jgi:sugar phosphate isomerase/epimerase